MHNNYYVLRHLKTELEQKIKGAKLQECFSQNKDELILKFETTSNSIFLIKAHLRSDFSCLSFPTDFARARRNSIDLFTDLIGHQVIELYQYLNERSFAIKFNDGATLLFKLHGNRSNIILFQLEKDVVLFKNSLSKDKLIKLTDLDRPIDQSLEAFLSAGGDWNRMFPTFNKEMKEHVRLVTANHSTEGQWLIIEALVNKLNNNPHYEVVNPSPGTLKLTMLEATEAIFKTFSATEALNFFFEQYIRLHTLELEKAKITRRINTQIKRTTAYIKKIEFRKHQLTGDNTYQQYADVLMANLHQGTSKSKEITLLNFYTNKQISIKLNPNLSLQKNAENYYRKGKNLKLEIESINKNLESKKSLLVDLKTELEQTQHIKSVKELKKADIFTDKKDARKSIFKEHIIDGYQVLIGKNAKQNDLLTLKTAKPNDLWLHAKDVTGSHVVIKHKAGQNFPKPVIEKAASLAAYYSKRKNDTLCPVIYTNKKFVRKRKGLAAGAVIVEKEKVILVEPSAEA